MTLSNNPLFSVLMANYNNAKYIKESIESVKKQTYNTWELIIVDDCSTDNSKEILEEIEDSRIRIYFQSENKGCGYTKHHAAELAKGDILGFLDPDDALAPIALQTMVEQHINRPNTGLINSDHFICDQELNIERTSYGACKIPENENYLTFGKGITAFASFKTLGYKKTIGINTNFKRAVDQDLYYKLEEQCSSHYIDIPLYFYRIHNKGISTLFNLSKSRYWLVRAKEDAYQRRKNNSTKNISKSELNAWWSILYASKSSDALRKFNICKFLYWVLKSIFKSPFDKYWTLKIKAVFVNTYFHSFLKSKR